MSAQRSRPESQTATRSTLLRRVHDRSDADGWREFDTLYRPLLTSYARARGLPVDAAEEITQQCLLAVASNIERFQRRRSFRGWLRSMVNHKVSDYLAQAKRLRRADPDLLVKAADPAPSQADLWERRWNEAHLHEMLAHLHTSFARHTLEAFRLYVIEERPVRQISEMLGMTPNQIYVAKTRVTRCLRDRFGEVIEALYGVSP